MIIRKPYAFLIKNFRKIHIVLLFLSLFIAYKIYDINHFLNSYMSSGIYDSYKNPITLHVSFWLLLSVLLVITGSITLLILLNYKKKPWKLYLLPVIEYIAMFFVLNMIKSFFVHYSYDVKPTDLRLSKDLLAIFLIIQLPSILFFIMRVFGLDIKKFNFNMEKEFLELSEEDREEIEIGLNLDRHSFIRGYKRLLRNMKYVYFEHKKICNTIICLFIIGILLSSLRYFSLNRSYSEGDFYSANGYTMQINHAYFTDKDYAGNIISNKSNFVIIDGFIKNNNEPRKIKFENFHLKASNKDFVTTHKTYENEFSDLGTTYDEVKEVKKDEELSFIVVFKVDKDLNYKNFNLFYQEDGGKLRLIKMKIKDYSKIENTEIINFGEEFYLNIKTHPDSIIFDSLSLGMDASYLVRNCTTTGCNVISKDLVSDGTYKILSIAFGSEYYNAKNMIDFLTGYGTIIYKDSSGEEGQLKIENLLSSSYFGKTVYLKVPVDVQEENLLSLDFIIRNKSYSYKLK